MTSTELFSVETGFLESFEKMLQAVLDAARNANRDQLVRDIISCTERASDILAWNGQSGVAIELIFIADIDTFHGCSVVQTGSSLDDALYRSFYEKRIETTTALPGKYSPDPDRSRFIWWQPGSKGGPAKDGEMGLGYVESRIQASAKMIGTVTTEAALNSTRDWRRSFEMKSIAAELRKKALDSELSNEIEKAIGKLSEGDNKKQLLDQQLAKQLEAERVLAEAAAKFNGLAKIVGFASALASTITTLGTKVDPSTTERLKDSASALQASEVLQADLQIVEGELAAVKKALQKNTKATNAIMSFILQHAELHGAPQPVLQQPRWRTGKNGVPILTLP